ncbi:U11/U12 small nuclear ribonucleoprotein 20 20kDa protein [Clonorchis sinensis]|uniref:U11/U12 small nuclear ribonucleoprotein 20 20kDa protein n=1 Tax=Clonorchis sinensis TaxID=79923 RepID=G7Y8K4_CLOSI|nr:U11/U12 small nuclear ribonucleoprotein 20 20kDa protein [Clonorchis sinensis]
MGGRGGPQRQSYHPPGLARDPVVNDRLDTGELNSNSSGEERPRLKLKPRTVPLNQTDDRHLSERSKAIFGTGRPREPSPLREEAPTTSSYMGKRFYCDYCDKSFPDNATNRRAHLNGVQHQQARRLHFDRYLAPQEKLVLERAKKPCIGFVRSGECSYGVLCKYSHMTPEMFHQLEQQAMNSSAHWDSTRLIHWNFAPRMIRNSRKYSPAVRTCYYLEWFKHVCLLTVARKNRIRIFRLAGNKPIFLSWSVSGSKFVSQTIQHSQFRSRRSISDLSNLSVSLPILNDRAQMVNLPEFVIGVCNSRDVQCF